MVRLTRDKDVSDDDSSSSTDRTYLSNGGSSSEESTSSSEGEMELIPALTYHPSLDVWAAEVLQAMEEWEATGDWQLVNTGRSSPVVYGAFWSQEAAVEGQILEWLDEVREEDKAHVCQKRLLTRLEELDAELEAIDNEYPIPDPPFEWCGTNGYDMYGFLT